MLATRCTLIHGSASRWGGWTLTAFLKLNYIYIIPDLIQRTRRELLELPGADAEVVLEIDLALRRNGKLLGARLDNWPPRPGK